MAFADGHVDEADPGVGARVVELALACQAPVVGGRPDAHEDARFAGFELHLGLLQVMKRDADIQMMRRVLHDAVEQPADRFGQYDVHGAGERCSVVDGKPVGKDQRTSGPVCCTMVRNEMNTFQSRNGMTKAKSRASIIGHMPSARVCATHMHEHGEGDCVSVDEN